jgi:radical SAM protein with 4Fe4S-binding SPASM domain
MERALVSDGRGSCAPSPAGAAPLRRIDAFVAATRQTVFVRREDRLLLLRPEKTLALSASALAILSALYRPDARSAGATLAGLAPTLGVPLARLVEDSAALLDTVAALLRDDFSPRPMLRTTRFRPDLVRWPILAEIALTYDCQNRCCFCYAASPHRRGAQRPMTTDEVKRVMRRVIEEAHVPSLSFTGGESTLRPDLEELVRHGCELGLRVNLITNGVRAADERYAARLVAAGLASAQVSLEAAEPELHDAIVGRAGAFARTVAGVRALRALGIHVHTNTTLCRENLDAAPRLFGFVRSELGLAKLSLNMLIRTGLALGAEQRARAVSYREIAARLPALLEAARAEGVRLIWYSPIPYCIFNPVLHGLGAKACACVDGILSIDPGGRVLPCSSFEAGIGSLLEQPFARIWESRAARYWRRKEFVPPPCGGCGDADICGGGCPLYWDAAGSFAELPCAGAGDARVRRRWERRRGRGRSFGVPAPEAASAGGAPWAD